MYYIAVTDTYGQIVTYDSDSKLNLLVDSNFHKNATDSDLYGVKIEGTTQILAENGVFVVDEATFSGNPGYNYSLKFETNGIDGSKPSNIAYMQSINSTSAVADFQVSVQLRECEVGEQFTDAGKCVLCGSDGTNSFFLEQMTAPGQCSICPEMANCTGGAAIGPQAGYWRRSNSTEVFI